MDESKTNASLQPPYVHFIEKVPPQINLLRVSLDQTSIQNLTLVLPPQTQIVAQRSTKQIQRVRRGYLR